MSSIFQYYHADITKCAPIGSVTLRQFLDSIRNPKQKFVELFKAIEAATAIKDEALRKELKQQLYSFTPAVNLINWRSHKNIQSFNGIAVLDFDKLTKDEAIQLKEKLFNENDFIIASWLSPSRHGVKAFASIPICHSVSEYKDYFRALTSEFSKYKGFDKTASNPTLTMFLSYDEQLLERDDYTTWQIKEMQVEAIVRPAPIDYTPNDLSIKRVYKITQSAINKIQDEGHPQLRAAAFILGGYVGSGTVSESEAIEMIHELIDLNFYLKQKASVYKKTAEQMIMNGKQYPKYLV